MADDPKNWIVQATGLSKQVAVDGERLVILRSVDLAVRAGDSVAILGASGSGKTTLLGLLAGLDVPSGGRVHLDGADLFSLDEDARAKLRGRMIGFVFQSFHLLPALNTLENIMLPLELAGVRGARARALEIMARVGLKERARHYPSQLSGGEQQRVAIARAFVARPRLLFADEPTGNLDTATGARIIDLLFALNREQGTTLVLVTHDESLAARCAHRLQLHEGALQALPQPEDA
ncbi:MAG: ATP-binding cassette domain-containing protein [Betaproteobacteria bacterium]|nr:ATP-binding cassette domain-containing protein [Betaproteobacteria bacterium]